MENISSFPRISPISIAEDNSFIEQGSSCSKTSSFEGTLISVATKSQKPDVSATQAKFERLRKEEGVEEKPQFSRAIQERIAQRKFYQEKIGLNDFVTDSEDEGHEERALDASRPEFSQKILKRIAEKKFYQEKIGLNDFVSDDE
jgi:CHASE2 domain-containing sensor protein